jgi:hypothetical protein
MRSPPLRQFLRDRVTRGLPPRQDLHDLVLTHQISPAAFSLAGA